MKPELPQNSSDPAFRKARLAQKRDAYEYDPDRLAPLVLLQNVPSEENFSGQYIAERLSATALLTPNSLAAEARSFLDPLDELQDYRDFFNLLPLPEVANRYQTDEAFAEQRLSGCNPLVIRRLKANDPRADVMQKIPSSKKEFEPLFDVKKELDDGNIYVADYSGTDPSYRGPSKVQGGTYAGGRKYLPKPIAFFWWSPTGISDRGRLVPVAIQLVAGVPESVVTPFSKDASLWSNAKLCVQIADANHHEMSSHLCRTHLVMGPFALATARQLADNHPLSLLLRPHFMFMLTNNDLGRQRLINPGGPVDRLLAGTIAESMELVRQSYAEWDLLRFAFPQDIEDRGMVDIPHYPYRDDGRLLWDAVEAFVSDYLKHFYVDGDAITKDSELQAWAAELASNTGGNVRGMPARFSDVQELVAIVTTVIFTCGPQHSAVNFAQYDYMAFVPNMPLAAYGDPLDTETDLLRVLPPFGRTADQLETIFLLSAYRYDRLGHYDRALATLYDLKLSDIFTDDDGQKNAAVVDMVIAFQAALTVAEEKIDAANQKRPVSYPFLKPSLVLNSISI